MTEVSEEFIKGELGRAANYSLVLLQPGPNYATHPDRSVITGAHVKRNFELRASGLLAIVGPMVTDGENVGMYIFNCSPEEAAQIIAGDPGVLAGLFDYTVQAFMSFPGDELGLPASS